MLYFLRNSESYIQHHTGGNGFLNLKIKLSPEDTYGVPLAACIFLSGLPSVNLSVSPQKAISHWP